MESTTQPNANGDTMAFSERLESVMSKIAASKAKTEELEREWKEFEPGFKTSKEELKRAIETTNALWG